MSHPVRWFRLAPLALALAAVVATAHADDPVRGMRMTRVYAIADLVTPIADMTLPCPAQCPNCPDQCPNCPAQCPAGVVPCKPAVNILDPNSANPAKDILVQVQQAQTGSFLLGVGVNSNAGLSGSIVFNERNFDLPVKPAEAPKTCAPPCPPTPTQQDKLIRLIQNTVAPQSWAEVGGCGTIDYMPIGQALVVNQTPDVQEQVANLLDALRRLQDLEVAVEVRLLTVRDNQFHDKLGLFVNPYQAGGQPTILNGQQVSQLIETLQGDRHTNILQAPKLTVFNGQRSTIRCTDEQFFVTNVNVIQHNGQSVYVPQNQPFTLGYQMSVRPTVSADHRFVRCELQAEHNELASSIVPLFPVSTFITPVFEGGAQGQPIPFTQFIQQPAVSRLAIEKSLTIPDGGTAVLYAGQRTKRDDYGHPAEEPVPLFCWVPALMELFTEPPPPPPMVREHLFVLVTPRVIVNQVEAVKRPAPEQLPMPKVVRIPADEEQVAPPRIVAATPMPAPPVAPTPPPAGPMVKIDAKLLKLDRTYFDRPDAAAWSDLSPKACKGQPCFLSVEEAERFCRAVCAQKDGEILSRPQVMTLNGQKAMIHVGSQETCVTGLTFVERDGDLEPVFHTKTLPNGIQMSVQPTASADGSFVRLAVTCEIDQAAFGAREYRVTIQPADGRDDVPTRTETVRRPVMNVQQLDATVALPWGRTVLLHIGDVDQLGYVLLLTPRVQDMAQVMEDPALPAPPPCPAAAPCPVTPPVMPCPTPACPPLPPVPPRVMMPPPPPVMPTVPPSLRAAVPAPSAQQIQLDMSIFTLSGSYFDRDDAPAWAKRSLQACANQPVLVDPSEAQRFVQSAHQNQSAKLLAQPRLITHSGRPATFNSGGQRAVPEVVTASGTIGTRFISFGTQVTFLPIAMSDGRIHLDMETVIGTLIPEAPFVSEEKARTKIMMRPGQAVLRYLGQHPKQFANGSMEMQHQYVLVAPHLVDSSEMAIRPMPAPPVAFEEQAAPPPATDLRLPKLLAKYRAVCAAGDTAAARALAAKCLAIDPTCFGK